MNKMELKSIFNGTMDLCLNDEGLRKSIEYSTKNQKVVKEDDIVEKAKARFKSTNVIVSKKGVIDAASSYVGKGKICILNFASAVNPGGGVLKGASAQEESICRCSTLYRSLISKSARDNFYDVNKNDTINGQLHNDTCIYTPDVVIIRKDYGCLEILKEEQRFKVDVISCAAPNLRTVSLNRYNPGEPVKKVNISYSELSEIHKKRITRIMDVSANEGVDILILGAFGCGAFKNPPKIVAEAFRSVLKEKEGLFETIEFAVYCSYNDDYNYRIFNSTLKR